MKSMYNERLIKGVFPSVEEGESGGPVQVTGEDKDGLQVISADMLVVRPGKGFGTNDGRVITSVYG